MAKTPLKAIKEWCIECMGGNKNEVKRCDVKYCPLYEFRLGHNPYRSGKGAGNIEALKKAREAKMKGSVEDAGTIVERIN